MLTIRSVQPSKEWHATRPCRTIADRTQRVTGTHRMSAALNTCPRCHTQDFTYET